MTEFGRHDNVSEGVCHEDSFHSAWVAFSTECSQCADLNFEEGNASVRLGGGTQLPQLSPRQKVVSPPRTANSARSIADWWDGDQRNAPLQPPPMPSPRERIFRSMVPFGDGCRPEDVLEPVVKIAVRAFSNREFAKVKESNNTHSVIQRCRHRQGPQTALDLLEAKGVLTLTSDPNQPGVFVEALNHSRGAGMSSSVSPRADRNNSPSRKQRGKRVPATSPHLKTEDSLGNPCRRLNERKTLKLFTQCHWQDGRENGVDGPARRNKLMGRSRGDLFQPEHHCVFLSVVEANDTISCVNSKLYLLSFFMFCTTKSFTRKRNYNNCAFELVQRCSFSPQQKVVIIISKKIVRETRLACAYSPRQSASSTIPPLPCPRSG